jgi:pimeloyl-ACP methyl ester carboxylesterase
MLILEHRYYGFSQPFNNWKLDNLKYLTINNALADIALLLTTINEDLVDRYGGTQRKVFVMGGSYPGALAAWFRYKYPHIATGALASSAVVDAIEDMWKYDEQAYLSMMKSGAFCPQAIEAINKHNDMQFYNDHEGYLRKKKQFGAES